MKNLIKAIETKEKKTLEDFIFTINQGKALAQAAAVIQKATL